MAEVRKINPSWAPVEFPDLQVGDTVHLDNVETLIEEGMVELVKEKKTKKEEK